MAKKPANEKYVQQEPSEVHSGLAEFINKTTSAEVEPETVALVQRLYPLYLKSPAVKKAREAERARKEAEKAAKEEAKRQRAQERLAKLEAERERLLASLGESSADRFTDDKGITFGKADPETEVEADDEPVEVEETEAEDEFVTSEESDDDDDDDEWDDDDDDEEDF